MITDLLEKLTHGQDLSRQELAFALDDLIDGNCPDVQFAGLLMGLRIKGETVEELIGAASVLRARALQLPLATRPLLCTAGTGGDGAGGLNLSTTAALIAAGAGASVAKHGNRAVSSKSGSSDVLEALGVPVDLSIEATARGIETIGIGFLFAPLYHPATKAVATIRRALGIRTLFNLLGPLTNPAHVRKQCVGVYHPSKLRIMAEALAGLDCERALVISAEIGLDEVAPQGKTYVASLRNGAIEEFTVTPADFGFSEQPLSVIKGGSPQENAAALLTILRGEDHPGRQTVLMNASAALVAADLAEDFKGGVALAQQAITSGAALAKLDGLRALKNEA
jgi:anthranilate phosphoribosyltransferase